MTTISRRRLLQRAAIGGAVTVAAPWLAGANARSTRTIRLNRNENAYGPSSRAREAMREAMSSTRRYADVETTELRRAIADFHRVTPEQVVPGCGSSEVLRMAVEAFTGSGRKLIVAAPTFDHVADLARRTGAAVVAIPLKRNYSYDLGSMLAHGEANGGLVYICNPNNPTGTLTPRRDLEAFIRRLPATVSVVIDEAYHHYVGESSDYASFIDRPLNDDRVIVTRTFSTIHGLAGLRVGYAVAPAPTAQRLAARRLSDGVNVVAAITAAAALDDAGHVRESANRNVDDRQEFFNQANARMLRWIDSQTNFVLLDAMRPAAEAIDHLTRHDILVAPVPPLEKSIRVTLGTPADMREFWRVWDLMPGHRMSM